MEPGGGARRPLPSPVQPDEFTPTGMIPPVADAARQSILVHCSYSSASRTDGEDLNPLATR
jgi:hypothetical protein